MENDSGRLSLSFSGFKVLSSYYEHKELHKSIHGNAQGEAYMCSESPD